MKPAILIRNARVDFGQLRALNDVSMTIAEGSTYGIVGESGSGKTTLMRTILGLQPLTSGSIELMGEPVGNRRSQTARVALHVQALLQDPVASLSPRMTIGRLLDEVSIVRREPRELVRSRALELFERLSLSTSILKKHPHQISGGQARRVCLARALLMRPTIIIADEPTAGLDVSVQGDLLNLLLEVKSEFGLTLVVISHNLAVIRLIADFTAVMRKGQIEEDGPSDQIFEAPKSQYARDLVSAWPRMSKS